MNARVLLASSLIFLSLSSGCVLSQLKVEHVLTGAPRDPQTGQVKVLMDGSPDPGPADEIGIITATGTLELATLPAVVEALQREAASLGADAIVRVRYDRGATGATATGVAVRLRPR